MRRFGILLATVTTLAGGGGAWADTWCNSNGQGAVFCDDFDRYCESPPEDPALACESGATKSEEAMRAVWVQAFTDCAQGSCELGLSSSSSAYVSAPYAADYPQQWDETLQTGGQLAYNKVNLGQLVTGTGASNLVLQYVLDVGGNNKQSFSHAMMELSQGDAHAPTDYILTPVCHDYCGGPNYGPSLQYRMICQQNAPPDGCPAPFTTPRAAIAVGFLATLDNDPCHCLTPSSQKPSNYHLAFFDGLMWYTLKSGLFPGGGTRTPATLHEPGDTPPEAGDFALNTIEYHDVMLTLDGTSCRVDLVTKYKGKISQKKYTITSYAIIPLQYNGPFNSLNYGVPKGCLLSTTAYECATPGSETCLTATPGSGGHNLDNVYLHGGETVAPPGACCLNNPLVPCQDLTEAGCQELGGRWAGAGTTCQTHNCCPYPFADTDRDGDVDQDDFGVFQACYTGAASGVPAGCTCLERVPDGAINELDLQEFANCLTGANVPWSASATPNCQPD